jgi:chemotaxis protein MotB
MAKPQPDDAVTNTQPEPVPTLPRIGSAEFGSEQYPSRFSAIERRFRSHSVFQVDEDVFPTATPRPSHWSVAWSDLMMTMFILFLCMFVYQMAHEDFLVKGEPEIIGGDTTEALLSLNPGKATLPFPPIAPGAPLVTSGAVKKVEPIQVPPSEPESVYPQEAPIAQPEKSASKQAPQTEAPPPTNEKIAVLLPAENEPAISYDADTIAVPKEETEEPRPLLPEKKPETVDTPITGRSFQEIYNLGKDALESNNLGKFATIDLVPDKTMRIILTSDLLFALGESSLSFAAQESLRKVGAAIRYTPYIINVVGHTDNIPMRSSRFASNWELSVSRATTVARFLIDQLGMNPNQFVVSGFSSYRPLVPNTTAENRAKNRRVEIIIAKRLPRPEPATTENIN